MCTFCLPRCWSAQRMRHMIRSYLGSITHDRSHVTNSFHSAAQRSTRLLLMSSITCPLTFQELDTTLPSRVSFCSSCNSVATLARIPIRGASVARTTFPLWSFQRCQDSHEDSHFQTGLVRHWVHRRAYSMTFNVLEGAHGHAGEEPAATADENGTEPRKEEIRFHCISRERGKASIKTPWENHEKMMTKSWQSHDKIRHLSLQAPKTMRKSWEPDEKMMRKSCRIQESRQRAGSH